MSIAGLLSVVKTEQSEVVPLYIAELTTVVLLFVYIDKKTGSC